MISHLVSIRQLSSEITSRMHLLSAHVRALRQAPPPEPELQARLWTDLELLATQLRGLADKMMKQAGAQGLALSGQGIPPVGGKPPPCRARPPAPALPNRAQPHM